MGKQLNLATQEILKQLPNVNGNLINQFLDDYTNSLAPKTLPTLFVDINVNEWIQRGVWNSIIPVDEALEHFEKGGKVCLRINFTMEDIHQITIHQEDTKYIPFNQILLPINTITKTLVSGSNVQYSVELDQEFTWIELGNQWYLEFLATTDSNQFKIYTNESLE